MRESDIPKRNDHFLPIEDYGVIGNLHTAALVSKQDASIDYLCFPEFDSPLLFGRLLTRDGGGFFQVSPLCNSGEASSAGIKWSTKQMYLPSSNILITRFLGTGSGHGSHLGGIGQVTDFLPVTQNKKKPLSSVFSKEFIRMKINDDLGAAGPTHIDEQYESLPQRATGLPWVVRKIETVRGRVSFCVQCQPAFDYGRISHTVSVEDDRVVFHSDFMDLELVAVGCNQYGESLYCVAVTWEVHPEEIIYGNGLTISQPKVTAQLTLSDFESVFFVLRQVNPDDVNGETGTCKDASSGVPELSSSFLLSLQHETDYFWHNWIGKCTYKGRWREMVHRSALVLKLLTFVPTGAIIAALTTSLPEELGGGKNWDYRFTWIRDAAFTVYAFLRIGLKEEAADFMTWIERRCREMSPNDPIGLRLMYDIRGRHPTVTLSSPYSKTEGKDRVSTLASEVILDHWTGYKDCKPVRIGNLAAFQQQLDIFGELLDAIYLCDKWVRPISYDFWIIIRDRIIPPVMVRWSQPDHGIWEVRDEPQHHVYSKVMSWVAMDRAIRLSQKRSLPCPLQSWLQCRDAIYNSIMEYGYNKEMGVFTQAYGTESLDASNLIMPLVFFLPPDDPRFLRTLSATLRPPRLDGLTVNNLVFRFHPGAGVQDPEGTFSICSFWLVEALARAGARNLELLEQASFLFEDVLGYANHLGLFSEEIGLDGSALGNFPQAFTHLSLISAAFNLDRALGP